MQHTCADCDHKFFDQGQSQDSISPAVQCPQCHSYRTQPQGIPDEANDMVHGIGAMPGMDNQDDGSGNPLQEGIMGDYQNRDKRDEAFSSVRSRISLFETPEFETTGLLAPPDLYRHGLETEGAHRAGVQIPKGITDNLHATLGNLQAWVENPYENGALRPYYNQYWKVIRPSFMKPGSLQIGVADPTMAEIINHVAQTDDITPLYEYRGQDLPAKTAVLAPVEIAADLAGGGAAATGAGATAESAGGIGGIMNKVMKASPVLNSVDDVLGMGGSGGAQPINQQPHDMSFYTRMRTTNDEDDAHPEAHDEIPKNEDGDSQQKDDGNSHEWQRDISVNDIGGTDHSPSFDPAGPGMQRFKILAPLLLQMIENGEDGSQDPLVQGLHQSLEAEIPGYLEHGDDQAGNQLLLSLAPSKAHPEKNDATHADGNAGGMHESKVAQLTSDDVAEFLPDFDVTPPSLRGFRVADTQGPQTPEQIKAVQEWLMQNGGKMGLEGEELIQTVLSVPTNPLEFGDVLAEVQRAMPPPAPPEQNAAPSPPPPAQEEAPPGATMPVPGMDQQMLSAIDRYAADSVATKCPHCGSHTTQMLDTDDGTSQCHGCHTIFKTEGKHLNKIQPTSTWNVDADFFTKQAFGDLPSASDDPPSVQGVPMADQTAQRDRREEQDSGHTWTDESGAPLTVGQEYEMSSEKYSIPDLIQISAVKPNAVIYRNVGEFGFAHDTELSREEANIERTAFRSTTRSGEQTGDDSLEENNDDNSGYGGEPEQSDMSAANGLVSASVKASGVDRESPALGWLMEGVPRTAGANYTAMEQRALIDEAGSARNADMLDLSGTHYISDAEEDQFLFGI